MNRTQPLEINTDFNQFKLGLANRIINSYDNTPERQEALDKIHEITFEQAATQNALCKQVFPILWDAVPPQNEKDYSYDSITVCVRIFDIIVANGRDKGNDRIRDKERGLRVRSYFYGNRKGCPIKGQLLQYELDKITGDNINAVIKEAAIREVLEESNITLGFIDDRTCSLSIYDIMIMGNYEHSFDGVKHIVTIKLSSNNYEILKKCLHDNLEDYKTFMENTGEVSGIILL